MRKLFFTLAMTLIAAVSYAYDVEVDGIYYNLNMEAKTAEVTSGSSKYSGSVVIPESIQFRGIEHPVTSIGETAFSKCSDLTSVTIPNSVTIIGDKAFDNCQSLTSITIPNSVTSIGQYAFGYCYSLPSIIIPNSVTSIGYGAFQYCRGLTSVTIGNSVTSIGSEAFASCPNLEKVICHAENVPSTDTYAFKDSYIEYATLMVPDASKENYKAANPWKKFGSIVPITEQELSIETLDVDGAAPAVVYDLQGHRLAQPQKGLNIINGKTVLVK